MLVITIQPREANGSNIMIRQLLCASFLVPVLCFGASFSTEPQPYKFIPCTKKIDGDLRSDCIALSDREQIVGYLAYGPSESDPHTVWIDELYTLPSSQRKGYATALLRHFLARAAKDYKRVALRAGPFSFTDPNNFVGYKLTPNNYSVLIPSIVAFYEKLGFDNTRPDDNEMSQKLMTHDQALAEAFEQAKERITKAVVGNLE